MFGYVKVNSSELKVKEYELYRGTYCGLCRAMGRCTGQCSRMTLNYDFVFLTLVRTVLEGREEEVRFEQKRCLVHPFKKRNSMVANPALDYSARAAALLSFHKVADDLSDERGGKKARAIIAKPFVGGGRKRALKGEMAELDEKIKEGLARLSQYESSGKVSVDEPAELFGEILGDIMSYGLEGAEKRIAYRLGLEVGAWIYIADALDDMREDAEKGRYNPVLLLYGGRIPKAEELEGIALGLKNRLYAATDALDLMDFSSESVKNVLVNILCVGMPDRIKSITESCSEAEKDRKQDQDKNKKRDDSKDKENVRKDGHK